MLFFRGGDFRTTTSEPSGTAPVPPAPLTRVPVALTEAWRAESPATARPALAGPTVVTAGGHELLGRDPVTGVVRWRYARDRALVRVAAFDSVPPLDPEGRWSTRSRSRPAPRSSP
ncbi:hypothetical protein [Actinokineospora sp. NBRC 105648]|uniref:hypothetical protein n=1 Tax=Actinokineospora sp. NBRC 105648 TaxID=3032206 RepID=UPI0024A276E2|nr:hypothetical protein [Actinokineospora sp. NBRC 105648]GLZ36902.1 hypothetical protein Acsp05_05270 [Actinokineospora sp. NBRC 105648]